jgi:hypothetical protein
MSYAGGTTVSEEKSRAETDDERNRAFEQEFLACIVGAAGQTLYQAIQEAKVGGQRLLPPAVEIT